MKFLVILIAAVASCFSLSSCGGGSSDSSTATVRPKTLDGILLNMDNCAQFEFLRNTGSSAALKSGDIETGTFIYTPKVSNDNLKNYDNLNGDKSNFRYPMSVSAATYTYRAINDSSAVLTMTGTGTFDVFFSGTSIILNQSWIRLFYTYSPQSITGVTRIVEVGLTFSSNGSYVTTDSITLKLPESPLVSTYDTVRIPTTASLAVGGAIPVNYNPVIDPLRPSRIVPASLSKRLMKGTNGIPDPTKDFTIQFVADTAGVLGVAKSTMPDEVGHAILSVWDPTLPIPGLRAVSTALDYTWRRIGGTDKGELVLSNIPDEASLPLDISLNGTYTLNFLGAESGTYTGAVDADTADAADVSGQFILRAGQ